jgi:long-chain fatty acid transport protein
MEDKTVRLCLLLLAILANAIMCPNNTAIAGNANLLLGFGAESNAMGGTDMAYSDTPSGINNNPAGIAQVRHSEIEFSIEPHVLAGIRHKDSLGNDRRTDHDRAYMFSGGWLSPLSGHPGVTVGVGLFAQGGVGFKYVGLLTDFDNHDDISALFGVFRIAPAIAWSLNNDLRLGLSVSINYAQAEQEVFPNTSDSGAGFFGTKITDVEGYSYSWRAGLQYDLGPTLSLGVAYGASTELKLKNGKAVVNFEDIGLGRVHYANAKIDGVSLPQEIGLGLSWQVTPKLNLGADINWYEWSEAIGLVRIILSNPQESSQVDEVNVESSLGGADNFSKSVAAIYQINDANIIYSGLSHTNNPISGSALSPINNFTAKWHINLGYRHDFSAKWTGALSYTYAPGNPRKYLSSERIPLGSASEEVFSFYSMLFSIRYKW